MQTHKNLTENLELGLQPNTPTEQMEGMQPQTQGRVSC